MSACIGGKSLVEELLQRLRLIFFRDGAYDGFAHDVAVAVNHISGRIGKDVFGKLSCLTIGVKIHILIGSALLGQYILCFGNCRFVAVQREGVDADEGAALLRKLFVQCIQLGKLAHAGIAGCEPEIHHGDGSMQKSDDGSMQKFPAFEGKDLDGNTVKSDELFSANAVTVVNFWFTTCNPCVGELSELDALNKELAEKGGALIGVNTFTLDGDKAAIADAKDVLAKKGATYQNIYFGSGGDAGKFVENVFAYPTTYVVDRNGNIVGDPIVGAVTGKTQAEALQAQIDKALAADMG